MLRIAILDAALSDELHPAKAFRKTRRRSRRREVLSEWRGRLHHRRRAQRQRWNV